MNVLGIIPARYASTRLEGKPLLNIKGQSMIYRVYERAKSSKLLSKLLIATDSELIAEECIRFNMDYILTSHSHNNGTERCGEVINQELYKNFDLILNIQGDEPFIHPQSIDELIQLMINTPVAQIGTLKKKIEQLDDLLNPSIIKVVADIQQKALYFSRNPIPYVRGIEQDKWLSHTNFYKHIGMYAYRNTTLRKIVSLLESPLENLEKLEQLRWLENGYSIYVATTEFESKSIDTQEDYRYILDNFEKYATL